MVKSKQSGLTLIEVILVLVIASAMLIMGFRQYQQGADENNMDLLKYNVSELFESLTHYYQANCGFTYDANNNRIPGDLAPAISGVTGGIAYPPTSSQPVSIGTLRTKEFLSASWPLANPIVDDTASGQGYAVQFNPILQTKNYSACSMEYTPGASPVYKCSAPVPAPSQAANQQTVVLWIAQIAVKIRNKNKILLYKNMLAADCSSSSPTECNNDANPEYLIWKRLPSFASPRTASSLWITSPLVKAFNLQYTHDQMYEFSYTPWANTQYYLCGG